MMNDEKMLLTGNKKQWPKIHSGRQKSVSNKLV